LIDTQHEQLSIRRQGSLVGLARASLYYHERGEAEENRALMRRLDEQYTRTPFYGVRRLTAWLRTQGYQANHKRGARLLRLRGLEAIYPQPCLAVPAPGQRSYP